MAFTLFDAATPSESDSEDGTAVTTGTIIVPQVSMFAVGMRFYKDVDNTGTHVGGIYNTSGTLLVSGTFTGETASGYQTLMFDEPLTLFFGTPYVVAVYNPVGHYSRTAGFFTSSGFESANEMLYAPRTDESPFGNGRYDYSGSLVYPTQTFGGNNYYVDIIAELDELGGGGSGVIRRLYSTLLRKYNVSTAVYLTLYTPDGTDIVTDATFEAGDVLISKNGGTPANTTNLPTQVGNGYSLTLTATEMQASNIEILVKDQTDPAAWLTFAVYLETYGNSSAQHEFDLDAAALSLGTIEGSSVLAKEATLTNRPTLATIEGSTVLAKEATVTGRPTLVQIEGSTVLAKETTVASRLASSSYTAPPSAAANAAAVWAESVRTLTSFGSLATDVWSVGSRTLTSYGTLVSDIVTAVWAAGSRTLTSAGALATDTATAVWASGTRTLTGFGTLVSSIWSNTVRTLTSAGAGGATAEEVWEYANRTITGASVPLLIETPLNPYNMELTVVLGDDYTDRPIHFQEGDGWPDLDGEDVSFLIGDKRLPAMKTVTTVEVVEGGVDVVLVPDDTLDLVNRPIYYYTLRTEGGVTLANGKLTLTGVVL